MAVRDGAGPRPAAHSAKRCFLNCLETSFKPCLYLPFCTASFQIACCVLQVFFVWHSSGPRTVSQGTPWQWGADRARGRLPIVPNVAKLASNLQFACLPPLPASNLLASFCSWLSSAQLRSKDPLAGLKPKTPWQWRSGPAAGSP